MDDERRTAVIDWAFSHYSEPYIWGGKGEAGWDCSEFCWRGLASVDLWDFGDTTADAMFHRLSERQVLVAAKGCLVFWKGATGTMVHVAFTINHRVVIGAHGGLIRRVACLPIDYRPEERFIIDPFMDVP